MYEGRNMRNTLTILLTILATNTLYSAFGIQ